VVVESKQKETTKQKSLENLASSFLNQNIRNINYKQNNARTKQE
jgi:flagellar hook-basal body complex protein FliE